MKLLKQKKIRRVTAAVICAAMLAPVLVRGVTLDGFYAEKRIAKTWNLSSGVLGTHEETGLACNVTPFRKNESADQIFS